MQSQYYIDLEERLGTHDYKSFDVVLIHGEGIWVEDVETAIKLARKWTHEVKRVNRHEAEIITCEGNFHGRTISIISFSSDDQYRHDIGPFTPGIVTVPYGEIDAIAEAIYPNTAAVLIEPIQGETGVIMPPSGYLT